MPHVSAPRNLPVRNGVQKRGWRTFLPKRSAATGRGGSFWSTHPDVPYRPVHVWQLWNEPNFKYFVARPNPVEYGKLIKLSYPVIRRADPRAKVVLGGLFAAPKEAEYRHRPPLAYFATDFLRRLYAKFSGGSRASSTASPSIRTATTSTKSRSYIESLRHTR